MGIFAGLTVRENLLLAARSGPLDEARLEWIFRFFPALKKFWHLPAGNLSGGQKQMLAISRAIVEPRKLVLVDEPTKGLAPAIINNLIEAFARAEEDRHHDPHGRAELPRRALARRLGRGHGCRAASCTPAAWPTLAADEALQNRLLGLSLEAHQ